MFFALQAAWPGFRTALMTDHAETDFADIFAASPLVLASRASALAMAQADIVQECLSPLPSEILSLTTRGDRILDRSLADAGGKGLFVKEMERRLLDGGCVPPYIR